MGDPQGLWFSALAEDYDRGRAGWPVGLVAGIEATAVLDLAAGTGKLTALLAERYADVIAVEPLATMRAVLEAHVPSAHVLPGSAEAIPLDDASVDAVFVAEAFHWFDSRAAGREIARVLRPRGWLVVCFNRWRSGFRPRLSDEARAYWREVMTGLPPTGGPKVETGEWRRGLQAFEPFEELALDHEWATDAAGVAAYYASVSSLGSVPPEQRVQWRDRLVELIPAGRYELALTAQVFRGRRASSESAS